MMGEGDMGDGPAFTEPSGRIDRQFERPHRPAGLRLANLAGQAYLTVRHSGLSLEPDELLRGALRRSEVEGSDFTVAPGTAYLEALGTLARSLRDEAALTPAGRYFAREQLFHSLENRLELHAALATDPDLCERPLWPALVIVGLPRSGTTLLQHLLARDPAHRVLRHWEAASPGRARSPEQDEAAKTGMDRSLRFLDYLAPDARILHPVDTLEPTECVTLFSNSLASLELATMHQVPEYLSWCLRSDFGDPYDEYALQLRVLQSYEHRSRWLLKSPAHLFWLDRLVQVLPGSWIVQLHRDPLEVLGSFCSLSAVLCGIGSDHVDLNAIGARWAPAWAEALRRADRDLALWPENRVVHVDYADLLRDPMAVIRRIYDGFGLDMSPDVTAAMAGYLATHRQHAGGVHRYSLAQFGLDPDEEAARFAPYREQSTAGPP
jgi:hypothetical protein